MNPYMLLSRLQQDCDYYLNFGARQPKHLWAGEEKSQISKMKEIFNALDIKPEWITMQDIENYENSFLNPLRSVSVTYEDGTVINTAMAAHLNNDEIRKYFQIGKVFNIGTVTDNLQKVVSIKIF